MVSSDDEGETVPTTVSDYEFIGDDEPISFAKLPVDWGKGYSRDGKKAQIYLSGKTDNGLRKIYVQVTVWKFDLPKGKPEISVLSVQGNWIKLLNPRKAYYDIIRTVVFTVHALHFAKWNPQQPLKALWDYLKKTFSMFERRPCVDDLADHVPLITEAVKWDVKLEESQLLTSFVAEKPWKKKTFNEDVRPPFIVDDANEKEDLWESGKADENEDSDSEEGDEADENEDSDSDESDCFDTVCAICDNGGNLICCDGKCMRSFHATAEDGDDSKCESLELTVAELEAINNVPFICDNCKYKKHQCFVCGKLGSSDESSNPEVFCCVNGVCGYFYHPHCVATLSHPGDSDAIEELEKRIADGEPFVCPIHKCHVCKELEVRSDPEMQFAVCRRCPKAYHRKCLPRAIAYEDGVFIQRAWEGLIPKRILIYCLVHEIDDDIQTPTRDHIVFPGPRKEKKTRLELEISKNKNLSKERDLAFEDIAKNRISGKQQKVNGSKCVGVSRRRLEEHPTPSSKRQKLPSNDRFSSGPSIQLSREKLKQPTNNKGGVFSDDRSYSPSFGTESEPVNLQGVASGHADNEITKKVKSLAKRTDNTPILDADSKRRVLTLMKDASSSLTLEDVKKRYKSPSTHTSYSRFSTDSVTLGKVEGSIQAVHAALTKLDEGSVRDAKAVCGNDLLEQVVRWKDKLKVYLAPFLHGMRYTSFGRHFTKNDKLKEIADILHWYFKDGDMLVDFCCGSNDFSCLMKKKLDKMGKICSFKNYDILQAKNDFNFERRDWMSVKKEELPDGSKLIMGLNPPFGLNASLANKFINKALQFKPKLLILIVPRETQRLDEKRPPYDLIWEDDQILAGKAFYLPGSVDVNDNQIEDWNNTAPVLYLWSNPAWTYEHRDIAEKHNHKYGALNPRQMDSEITSQQEGKEKETTRQQKGLPCGIDSTPKNLEQEETISPRDGLPHVINSADVGKSQAAVKNHHESSSKSLGGEGNKKRPASNIDQPFGKLSTSRHQSPDLLDTYPTRRGESPSQFCSERGDYWHNREFHLERDDSHRQSSLSREVSQVPCERGGYQQTNFSSHQSYSRMEHDGDGDEVSELLKKYGFGEPELGTIGGQAYGNHDYAQPPQHSMSSGLVYRDYSPPAATGLMDDGYHPSSVQVGSNSWNQGATLTPNHSTGYSQQYELRNVAPSSNYSEMSRPASLRYAAHLHDTHHDPPFLGEAHFTPQQHPNRAPLQFSNQGPLNFAEGPYNPPPHQASSGWLHDD